MKEYNSTTLEIYINKVFKLLIVIIPSIALVAGLTFSVLHYLGYYPNVKTSTILIFDVSCIFYTIIGIIFNRNCEDEEGVLKPGVLKKRQNIYCFINVNPVEFYIFYDSK